MRKPSSVRTLTFPDVPCLIPEAFMLRHVWITCLLRPAYLSFAIPCSSNETAGKLHPLTGEFQAKAYPIDGIRRIRSLSREPRRAMERDRPRGIAVIDVGATSIKIVLFDGEGRL